METTRALTKTGGITETGLKWIALVTMVMDHIHYFFGFTGMIPEWFSMVGRLGAPLFLFCLVEGFTHTHSRKRYFARVYVLSTAMSLLFFFMAFQIAGQHTFVAVGRSRHAIFFSLLRKVFIVVPLTYLLPYTFHMGTDGVFLAEPVSNVIGGSLCFITMLFTVLPELNRMENQ